MVPYSYNLTSKQNVPRLEIKFEDSPFGVMKGMWDLRLDGNAKMIYGYFYLNPAARVEQDMGTFPYINATSRHGTSFQGIIISPTISFCYDLATSASKVAIHLNLWEHEGIGYVCGYEHGSLPDTHPLAIEFEAFAHAVQFVIDGEFLQNSLLLKRRHEREKLQKRMDKQLDALDDKIVSDQNAIQTNGWIQAV